MSTKAKELPTQEYLAQIFDYDERSGDLYWKSRSRSSFKSDGVFKAWNSKFSGKLAGAKHAQGYVQVTINGGNYLAHRIICKLLYDIGCDKDVDHINGNRSDNSKSNLRIVSRSMNLRNSASKKAGVTGHCGVSVVGNTEKYRSYLGLNGKQIHLGVFDTIEDAVLARKVAQRNHGFTDRHGK